MEDTIKHNKLRAMVCLITKKAGSKNIKLNSSIKTLIIIAVFTSLGTGYSGCALKYKYLTVYKNEKKAYVYKTQNMLAADSILEQKFDIKNFASTSLNNNIFFEIRSDSFYIYCENKDIRKSRKTNKN